MPNNTQPSVSLLKQALTVAEKIQSLQTELDDLLAQVARSGSGELVVAAVSKASSSRGGRRKPVFSAAARAKIAAAQRARWAKVNKGKAANGESKTRKKPKFSAEAREKIAAAQRARWAKARKEKAS